MSKVVPRNTASYFLCNRKNSPEIADWKLEMNASCLMAAICRARGNRSRTVMLTKSLIFGIEPSPFRVWLYVVFPASSNVLAIASVIANSWFRLNAERNPLAVFSFLTISSIVAVRLSSSVSPIIIGLPLAPIIGLPVFGSSFASASTCLRMSIIAPRSTVPSTLRGILLMCFHTNSSLGVSSIP